MADHLRAQSECQQNTDSLANIRVFASAISRRLTLKAADADQWRLVLSPLLLDELRNVLRRDKFRRYVGIDDVEAYVTRLRRRAETARDPALPPPVVTRDPNDDYLVALARSATVDVLISGDVHLTELVDLVPPVRTPAEFLAILEAGR